MYVLNITAEDAGLFKEEMASIKLKTKKGDLKLQYIQVVHCIFVHVFVLAFAFIYLFSPF